MSDAAVITVAVLIFSAFICSLGWVAWRAFTPRGFALYFLMWACGAFATFCASYSTWPSSAPRLHADGTIVRIVDHKEGKWDTYILWLARPHEPDLALQASATLPFFAKGQDLVKVTYLDEKVSDGYPRAIGFRVLTGPRTGYNDSVSADWIGPWLGVLLGPLFGFAALWKAFDYKRTKVRHASGSPHVSGGVTQI